MKTFFATLILSLLFSGIVFSQAANPFAPTDDTEKLVSLEMLDNHIISLMNQYNISGLSAAIVKEGRIVWKSTYGLADRENLHYVNDSTSFLIYSITKTFTGIGLMQLFEDGEFELDDPINDYLPFEVIHPDYPDDQITFRMIMTHTSGIKDNFTVINSLLTYNTDTDLELSDVLENYLVEGGEYYGENTSYTNSRPGTNFSYSNINAALGGYLIQCISGQDYKSFIKDRIFTPCGMNNSFFSISECDADNLAMEYTYSGGEYQASGINSNPLFPAGFLRSDINDMAKYLQMLLSEGFYDESQIIDSDILEVMMTEDNHEIAPNSGLFFGYDADNDLWGHNGGFYGVKTGLFMDKEEDWGVVVLSNGDGEPWQILFMLYQYAKDFEIFNITKINIDDTDQDLILEQGESIDMDILIRNNSVFDFENINTQISCNNELISFSDDSDNIPVLNSGQTLSAPLEFQFNLGNFTEGFEEEFVLKFYCDDILIDSVVFTLFFGNADVLLINDEEHVYRNRNMSAEYFKESIINSGRTVREYDINLFQIPSCQTLANFSSVVWFTGLDNEMVHDVMKEEEQELIENYLDNGGNLFLSSQNVSDAVSGSDFMTNYLKAEQIYSDYTGTLRIIGIDTVLISQDLDFYITGGDGTNTQYSPSCIEPINGSHNLFNYYSSGNGGGIFYDGDYKLVFLPFCFSSIDNEYDRDELMSRILDFFEGFLDIEYKYLDDKNIIVFPNPAYERKINIFSPYDIDCRLSIYDISGKVFFESESFKIPGDILCTDFPCGSYYIIIKYDNSVFMNKIVFLD